MRVTQQMLMDRASFDLSSAVERVLRLQGQLSSGRRLQKPSDDPTDVPRALSFRTTMATIIQYKSNASWGEAQLAATDQTLGSANLLVVRARELAISAANDHYDAAARQAAATEASSIFDQLLQLANTQSTGRFLFSGYETRTQALLATSTGVVYQGDQGSIFTQIESASQIQVNLIASNMFLTPQSLLGEGTDLNRGIDATTPLADLHQASGVDITPGTLDFTDDNSGTTVTVDLSAAATIGDVIAAINAQLSAGGINNVTASVSPTGNSIRIDANPNGLISTATELLHLNKGSGIDLSPGTLRVTNDSGSVDVTIDLSSATTVNDLINSFNSQLASAGVSNVTMGVNAAQTGLEIVDSNGPPLGLRIEDFFEQQTAHDLGLVGYINDQLIGGDLNPERSMTIAEAGAGQTTGADLGLLGSFVTLTDGADLDPILTLTTPLSQLDDGRGLNLGTIRIAQGDTAVLVNLSSASTVGDVIDSINASGLAVNAALSADGLGITVATTDPTRSLQITDGDVMGGATALGISGSPDLMGSMMLLIEGLENNDRDLVSRLIGNLEAGSNQLLDQRASVGARVRRLQSTSDRLTDIGLLLQNLSSQIEDADIIAVTTQLALHQNVYQSALNAVARSLMPSLADFIR